MPAPKHILDFIIVGAMKSGTSSLGFHLGRHPEICIPEPELHFFNNPKNYARGFDWYEKQLRKEWKPGQRVVGEKTPTYCYQADCAEKIRADVPHAKLIWIFRHPVDRAYSNYIHAIRGGGEYLSFEQAVAQEPERIRTNIFRGYVERSRYHLQVERFLALFPREQMHFMLFEDLVADPHGEMRKVFELLGVDPASFQYVEEKRNVTIMPRFPFSVFAARTLLGASLPTRVIQRLNIMGKAPGYPKIDPALHARLSERFRDDNARLEKLIGKSVAVWDAPRSR